MEKKLNWIFAGIIVIVFSVVFSTQFDEKLHISGDNAVYLKLAQNMAEGHGYASLGTDGQYQPAGHFPPAYSFTLSIFMRVGIHSLVFFKALNGLFLLGSLILLFLIVKGVTCRPVLAFCAVTIAIFSPQTLNFSTIVMSEMLYMFLITLGMFALWRYSANPSGEKCKQPCFLKNGWFWTAMVSVAAAYYTRSVAMSAVGAVLVFFLFCREWKQAAVYIAGTVALLLPWSLRNAALGIESRYFGTIMTVNPWRPEQGNISSVGEMVDKMINNFDETVIKGFREILFPFWDVEQGTPSGLISVICGMAVLAVVFYGAWKMGRMRWMFIAYIAFNIGLFMLWHGGNGSRYVTPIAPVLFVCFYTGLFYLLELVLDRSKISEPSWLPYIFLLVVLPTLKPLQLQAEMAGYPYPPAYSNYFKIAGDLNRQAPAGTVVVARKPDLFNYHADRLVSVNYKFTSDPRELVFDLVMKNTGFVVLEQLGYGSTPMYLLPAIQAYPELFPVVWHLENPNTYLLAFDLESAKEILNHP